MITRSRSRASATRHPLRCGPCTIRGTRGSGVERDESSTNKSFMQSESAVMSESGVIARLAAQTRMGYSLEREFYCDEEVFAADMDQVIGRKWLVAGHVDRVRNRGD